MLLDKTEYHLIWSGGFWFKKEDIYMQQRAIKNMLVYLYISCSKLVIPLNEPELTVAAITLLA